ncbi:YbaB/EbfC family nucleoid-associated protein [Nocardia asteroides]|nr:YbaB/EbfC family nucleoid-associated protein [Nocardia asteroides]
MDGVSARALEIKQINEQLAAVRGSARSADGSVFVETDVNGRITDLYLADYAMENGPDRLAALITDRHRTALDNANAEARRIFEAPRNTPAREEPTLEWIPTHLRRDDIQRGNEWREPSDWERGR